jgi:hypothetical protein
MATQLRRPKSVTHISGPLKWTCTFDYTDHEGVSRKGKGRTFTIDGQDLDLFPTGVLAAVLHRSRKTLYVWEEKFGFPPALYFLADDERKKRWYSRKQLTMMRAAYDHYGELTGPNYKKLPEFISVVRKLFYSVDRPITERTDGNPV